MALKIIHCADVHFDSVMSGIKDPKKVNIRREDLKKTFQNIIAEADGAAIGQAYLLFRVVVAVGSRRQQL